MQPESPEISHVSDTALMTAACRAMETERPDGLIQDPFAAELAGPRGMAIARAIPGLEKLCFGIAIRSRFLDQLVTDTVSAHGIATVLSVGAGLDTRPWRLELPASLDWVEIDFPDMLDYKDSVLGKATSKCRRRRLAVDVNESSGRASLFAAAAGPTLMITEGLLMYLPGDTIEALAATTAVSLWLLDVSSPEMWNRLGRQRYQAIEDVRAADHLDGLQTLDVLSRGGWVGLRRLSYAHDVMAVAAERVFSMFRNLPADQMPKPLPPDDPSGVHLLGRMPAPL